MAPVHPAVVANFYAAHPSDTIDASKVYPRGKAPPVPVAKVIKGRLAANKSLKSLEERDRKYHIMKSKAEEVLNELSARVAANADRIRESHIQSREEILLQRERGEVAWKRMTDARRKNEKWEEAVWREVWKREIEALHLLTVSTTRVVNSSMPNLPNPIGPDTNETAASPAEAPQMEAEYPAGLRKVTSVDDSTTHARSEASAAALARFRLSVSFEALADSITEVEQWPRPLKIAIDHSLQGIIAWLKTVQKTKCVYWLWHDRDLPEQFDRSREDILRYVASVCKLQEALGSSYFFPRQATSKSFKESFFPTIVFELSAYIPRFEDLAANACEARGHHFLGRAWMTQAKELIVNQYKLLSTEDRQKPILIIIDSLDRCTRKEVPQLLNALTMCIENLPICILISSKRVQGVEERFNLWKGKDYVVEGELMVDPKDMEDWESKNIRDEKSGGMKEGKSEDSLLDRVGDEFDEELGDPTTPRPGKTFA